MGIQRAEKGVSEENLKWRGTKERYERKECMKERRKGRTKERIKMRMERTEKGAEEEN